MTEHSCVPDIQESFDYIYDYTYCDNCGSFNIGSSTTLPRVAERLLILVMLASLPVAIVVGLYFNRQLYIGCSIMLVGLSAFTWLWETSHLKCNKCGNQHITASNVLNYAKDDQSVVDVPLNSVLKDHIETVSA
ncbi:MAG: hypothetical protein U0559_16450 [Anaerolineae bacterium]